MTDDTKPDIWSGSKGVVRHREHRPRRYRGERRAPKPPSRVRLWFAAIPSWAVAAVVMVAVWLATATVILWLVPQFTVSPDPYAYQDPGPRPTPAPTRDSGTAGDRTGQTTVPGDAAATGLPMVMPVPAAEETDGTTTTEPAPSVTPSSTPPSSPPVIVIGPDVEVDVDPPVSLPPPASDAPDPEDQDDEPNSCQPVDNGRDG
jgi:hypothetical protein